MTKLCYTLTNLPLLYEFNCHAKRKLNDDLVISHADMNVPDKCKANHF